MQMRFLSCVVLCLLSPWVTSVAFSQSKSPLTEAELTKRLAVLDADEIVTLVKSRGVSFAVNAAVRKRLTKAGATSEVLAAIAKAERAGSAVDFKSVLRMLKEGKAEADIRKRLRESPTEFVLDAEQIRELTDAGASEGLVKALQTRRVTLSHDVSDFAFILDCSGSMADKTPDGVSKMEAAKKVVIGLIRDIPNGKRLTFVVYGHNIEEECKAVKVVCSRRKIDSDLKKQLARQIAALQPRGHTPIARALQMTETELTREKIEGMCEVVLITDGMETCHGNPAAQARKLASSVRLLGGVNVIGFDLEPKEKKAVKAISDAGSGTYYDAPTAADLVKRITELEEKRRKELAEAAAKANKIRAARDKAAREATASAEKAEEAAEQARASATRAGKAGKEAVDLAEKFKVGLEDARIAAAHVMKAEEAAEEAKAAAARARKAADQAEKASTGEEAAELAQTAADEAEKAEKAAARALAAAVKAEKSRDAVKLAKPAERTANMDPLPDADRIKWDISLLKKKENFTILKQTVKEGVITWLVQVNSNTGSEMLCTHGFFTAWHGNQAYGNHVLIDARFFDEDDVDVARIMLSLNPNKRPAIGDKVRVSLQLPKEETMKKVKKVDFIEVKK